jgi:hypothetical protein
MNWIEDTTAQAPCEFDLCVDCRCLSAAPFGQNATFKTAADSILSIVAHLSFLAIYATGAGLLFVSPYIVEYRGSDQANSEGLVVDEEHVTIPVLAKLTATISEQPRTLPIQPQAPSIAPATPAVPPRVPNPPTIVSVN